MDNMKPKAYVCDKKGSNAITVLDLLVGGRLLDCGELVVSKTTLGRRRVGERFLIYLPGNRCYLWRELHERKVRVRVYLELPESQDRTSTETNDE
jgi:hypothetical protein